MPRPNPLRANACLEQEGETEPASHMQARENARTAVSTLPPWPAGRGGGSSNWAVKLLFSPLVREKSVTELSPSLLMNQEQPSCKNNSKGHSRRHQGKTMSWILRSFSEKS